jgi:cystathionine beta-lyase/cystathionine gamma-synthase
MRPATISHAGLTPEERADLGISDGLLRLSLGLESVEDLCADIDQALATCAVEAEPRMV